MLTAAVFGSETIAASKKPVLNKKSAALYQGSSMRLKLKNVPAAKVTWTSGNNAVAKVSENGTVTAISSGKCRIQAVYKGKAWSCKVTVKKLQLKQTSLSLVRFRQKKLALNAAKVSTTWTSSDPEIALVTKTGLVKAKNCGTCDITAKHGSHVMTCRVFVLPSSAENLSSTNTVNQNRKKIVLAGSSTLDYWAGAFSAFSPYSIVNNAVGGSTVSYWLNYYQKLIVQYKPSAVVVYVGANDIGNGNRKTGIETAEDVILLLSKLRSALKKTPVYYISVCPCPGRPEAGRQISDCNARVRKWCSAKANVYYIDAASYISKNGIAQEQYYLSDGLHPNSAGYAVWKKRVAQVIVKSLKKKGIKY